MHVFLRFPVVDRRLRFAMVSAMFAMTSAMFVMLATTPSVGQTIGGLNSSRDALGTQSRISEQRVLRQTEVMRLERMIEGIANRVTRIERLLLANSRFPAITIPEASAALELAQTRLAASANQPGNDSTVQLATDQLAVAQARGQLTIAKAAQAENLIMLDLERIHAEREYVAQSTELQQLERAIAKGYMSSSGLAHQRLETELAKKRFDLAKLRLETQRTLENQAAEEKQN
ncbi:MAG: hypothetical protein ACR2NZ_07470 [Rubripirellula sp.]